MKKLTRRKFIKNSTIAAAGIGMASSITSSAWAQISGANNDIRVAIVGFNSKGAGHIKEFQKIEGVRVAALCDVDKDVLEREVKNFTDNNKTVEAYTDIRKVLDNKDIDAIVIATPNHWHSLMTVWACQAGKDVYVEKPVSHNIWEGRKAVEAARKYKRIVQAGTHKRSDQGLKEAFEYIHQGNIGNIIVARGFCYKMRMSIGKVSGIQPIPSSVDYNLWCGPAPMEPLRRKNLHYDWHWVWPTGNGDIGNQGIHEMDMCRWALGQNKLPNRVMSIGGRLGYDDDGETANTQIAIYDYDPAPIIFETRGLPKSKEYQTNETTWESYMDRYKMIRIGIVIECEGGYFAGGGGGGSVYDKDGNHIKRFTGGGGGDHPANFIKAVRSRNVSDLNADILEGHLSSSLCHLGNISYRLGQKTPQEEIRKAVKSNPLLLNSFERFDDHLYANWIDTSKTPATLGPWLEFNPETEKFTGDDDPYGNTRWANDLLRRKYRKGFEVPEIV